jgi:hypothetical protein
MPSLRHHSRMRHNGVMENNGKFTNDVLRKTIADFIAIPVLLLWSLLSFGPLAGLVTGGGPFRIAINVLFLATSLWGVLSAFVFMRWLTRSRSTRDDLFALNRIWLAPYAGVWSVLYLVFVFTPR